MKTAPLHGVNFVLMDFTLTTLVESKRRQERDKHAKILIKVQKRHWLAGGMWLLIKEMLSF